MVDEHVVGQADLEAGLPGAQAEVVLLAVAAAEGLLVEDPHPLQHLRLDPHAEADPGRERGPQPARAGGDQAGEALRRVALRNRVVAREVRDAADGGVVGEGGEDAGGRRRGGRCAEPVEEPLEHLGVRVEEEHVAPGGVAQAAVGGGHEADVPLVAQDDDARVGAGEGGQVVRDARLGAGVVQQHQPEVAGGVAQHALRAPPREGARVVDRHHHVHRPVEDGLPAAPQHGHVLGEALQRVLLQLHQLGGRLGAGVAQHALEERAVEDVEVDAVPARLQVGCPAGALLLAELRVGAAGPVGEVGRVLGRPPASRVAAQVLELGHRPVAVERVGVVRHRDVEVPARAQHAQPLGQGAQRVAHVLEDVVHHQEILAAIRHRREAVRLADDGRLHQRLAAQLGVVGTGVRAAEPVDVAHARAGGQRERVLERPDLEASPAQEPRRHRAPEGLPLAGGQVAGDERHQAQLHLARRVERIEPQPHLAPGERAGRQRDGARVPVAVRLQTEPQALLLGEHGWAAGGPEELRVNGGALGARPCLHDERVGAWRDGELAELQHGVAVPAGDRDAGAAPGREHRGALARPRAGQGLLAVDEDDPRGPRAIDELASTARQRGHGAHQLGRILRRARAALPGRSAQAEPQGLPGVARPLAEPLHARGGALDLQREHSGGLAGGAPVVREERARQHPAPGVRRMLGERQRPRCGAHAQAGPPVGERLDGAAPGLGPAGEQAGDALLDRALVRRGGRGDGGDAEEARLEHLEGALTVREFVQHLDGGERGPAAGHDPGVEPVLEERHARDPVGQAVQRARRLDVPHQEELKVGPPPHHLCQRLRDGGEIAVVGVGAAEVTQQRLPADERPRARHQARHLDVLRREEVRVDHHRLPAPPGALADALGGGDAEVGGVERAAHGRERAAVLLDRGRPHARQEGHEPLHVGVEHEVVHLEGHLRSARVRRVHHLRDPVRPGEAEQHHQGVGGQALQEARIAQLGHVRHRPRLAELLGAVQAAVAEGRVAPVGHVQHAQRAELGGAAVPQPGARGRPALAERSRLARQRPGARPEQRDLTVGGGESLVVPAQLLVQGAEVLLAAERGSVVLAHLRAQLGQLAVLGRRQRLVPSQEPLRFGQLRRQPPPNAGAVWGRGRLLPVTRRRPRLGHGPDDELVGRGVRVPIQVLQHRRGEGGEVGVELAQPRVHHHPVGQPGGVSGAGEELQDIGVPVELDVRAVEEALGRPGEPAGRHGRNHREVRHVRDGRDERTTRTQEPLQLDEHRPGLDEVLEDVRADHHVEAGCEHPALQQRRHVAHQELVAARAGVLGVPRVPLHPGHVAALEAAQRGRERPVATAHVEHAAPLRHEGDELAP